MLDAPKPHPNFSNRTHAEVLRVKKPADGKTATGLTQVDDATQEQLFQPADLGDRSGLSAE